MNEQQIYFITLHTYPENTIKNIREKKCQKKISVRAYAYLRELVSTTATSKYKRSYQYDDEINSTLWI